MAGLQKPAIGPAGEPHRQDPAGGPDDRWPPAPNCRRRSRRIRQRGAIYARFSSRFQHSTDDQVRACRAWADANDVDVADRHVFFDERQTGKKRRRAGLAALMAAVDRGEVDVLVVFSTSRLSRKQYQSLKFVEEEVVDRRKRCVFVKSGIDTDNAEQWRRLMQLNAIVDEMTVTMQASHVRAAHEGQLREGLVFGTLTYGYRGEPVPGRTTKLGRPARTLAVDPVTSVWVRRMFEWFARDRLTVAAVVRRLNDSADPAPLPDRSQAKRWTYGVVRRALGNARYRGAWQYGRTEAVWQNKADYSRQFERERPLLTVDRPDLRVVDEATWAEAQRLLADHRGRGGRRPREGTPAAAADRQPDLLNRLCVCAKHDRPLLAGGKGNAYMYCPACRADPGRALVSLLPRRLGTRLLCERLAALVRADAGGLATRVVDSCRRQAESLQRPDPADLEEARRRAARLTRQIRAAMTAPADDEREEAENRQVVTDLRRDRSAVEADVERLEAMGRRAVEVPAAAAVEAMLADLGRVLSEAAAGGDDRRLAAARRVVEAMTGGRIVVSQCGAAKRKGGWLRGTFEVRPLRPLCYALGVASLDDGGPRVEHVDFRGPTRAEALADAAKGLWDAGLLVREIAAELSRDGGGTVGRAMVNKALAHWFGSRGLPLPDGRTRRSTLGRRGPPTQASAVADRVMGLIGQGMLYVEVADRLGVGRDVVTAAVREGHAARGLAATDGRARRKALDHKSRDGVAELPPLPVTDPASEVQPI